MKKIALLSACLSISILPGCSSIVNGTHQSISLETPPVKQAQCALENDKGKWVINKTPGTVVVHRSYKNLVVTCEKKGYRKGVVSVKSKTKGMAFGNVVFGGVIGAGVDMANGSAYDYPAHIVVPLAAEKHKR